MLRNNVAFGSGPRQRITRSFAIMGIKWNVEVLVKRDVLRQAKPVKTRIKVLQWSDRFKNEKTKVVWKLCLIRGKKE